MGTLLAQAAASAPDDGSMLLYGTVLFGLGLVLMAMELLLPSGGLLGVTAGLAALAGVGCFFAEDAMLGFASLLALGVVTPVLVVVGIKLWPHTPVGRLLVLGDPGDDDAEAGHPPTAAGGTPARPAVGALGRSITPLRRIGSCRFDGVRFECLAESGTIDADRPVVVRRVSGIEVFVREIEEEEEGEEGEEVAEVAGPETQEPETPGAGG